MAVTYYIQPYRGPALRGSFSTLARAKASAQRVANEQGGSAMIISMGGKRTKSYSVKPKKSNPRTTFSKKSTAIKYARLLHGEGKRAKVRGKTVITVPARVRINPK